MALTIYTLYQLQAQIAAFYAARFPGRDLGSESWIGKHVRALAMALLAIQKAIEDADRDGTPSSRTSTAALDGFAFLFGLPSNLGGYGRDGPVAATGGAGLCSGTNGTIFADQLLLFASDGATRIRLSGGVTIPGVPPGSGTMAGVFVAETTGTAGNLPIGSVLLWSAPPAGADATVTLTSPLAGGLDSESDFPLLARLLAW